MSHDNAVNKAAVEPSAAPTDAATDTTTSATGDPVTRGGSETVLPRTDVLGPLHCIVPPHILRAIADNGDDDDRAAAQSALRQSAAYRERRETHGRRRAGRPRGVEGAAAPVKKRAIYNAHHGTHLPGTAVRAEGAAATGDAEADEAYDGMGATWDLYDQVFGRNSYDDNGAELVGSVHYSSAYDNAFWNGQQMAYGDGDGKYFNRFTISVDVIGHELTHAVTNSESNLDYNGQSGALNESISDVFGSMVKQYVASPQQTADQADWLIGAGLLTSKVHGVALRSMVSPGTAYDDPVLGKDPQPADMGHYVDTTQDNGGVHINSGIPNRAFALFAKALDGHSWDQAGKVWYATCIDDAMPSSCNFQQFADLTAAHAQSLFGDEVHAAAVQAWATVGITVTGAKAPTPPAPPAPPAPPTPPAPPAPPGDSSPTNTTVSHTDLTSASGAPAAEGHPVAFASPNGTNHVVYRSADGHLHDLSWTDEVH